MSVTIRPGTIDDAVACGTICYEAFRTIAEQHNFPPDFPSPEFATGLMSFALSHPEIYSIVAELDGKIVGSNFLWERSAIAGVGPITVDPAVQNARIGRRLMRDVLDRTTKKNWAGVRLVQAAYQGRSLSLYARLGFDAREPLSNLQGPAVREMISGHDVRPATAGDLDGCNDVCRRIHGHDRGAELLDAINQGTATVVERASRISGYATLIGFFGHAVGETNKDLKALIAAAPSFAGPGFLLPTRNAELFRWCLERGLRVVQPLTLMTMGLYNEPRGAFLPSILY